jgi:uncharacterized protein YjbI with pentapeptide repeats
MFDGKPCGRAVIVPIANKRCICHLDAQSKSDISFQYELDKIFQDANSEYYDMTGFIFPKTGYKFPRVIERDAYFQKCKFYGIVDFGNTPIVNLLHIPNLWKLPRKKISTIGKLSIATDAPEFPKIHFNGKVFFHDAEFLDIASFFNVDFKGIVRFDSAVFHKLAVFSGAKFQSNAIYYDSKFHDIISFGACEFKDAEFKETVFEKIADVSMASFGSVSFNGSCFGDGAHFYMTTFENNADFTNVGFLGMTNFTKSKFCEAASFEDSFAGPDSKFYFEGDVENGTEVFNGQTSFKYFDMDEAKRFVFRNVSLRRCQLLHSRLRHVHFIDVAWPQVGRAEKRKAIYDELVYTREREQDKKRSNKTTGNSKTQPIAQVYRQLQENYTADYRYHEAGDFYIREQEVIRKAKGKYRQYMNMNMIYKMVSYYGESYIIPLCWLIAILILFPCIWLFIGGINLGPIDIPESPTTVFHWSWHPKNVIFLQPEYLKAFCINSAFVSLNRGAVYAHLPHYYQHLLAICEIVLVAVFSTLLILALRRRFKRKSF